jgi:hypothetical protein
VAQLGCGKNWLGNHFFLENLEFCGIETQQSVMT